MQNMQNPEILSARSDYRMYRVLPRIQRKRLLDFSSYWVQLSILYLAKIKVIYKKKSIRSIFHEFDDAIYVSF